MVRHLYTHIDGGTETNATYRYTCPISKDCNGFDLSEGSLLTHISSFHSDQEKEFQLESIEDPFGTRRENESKLKQILDVGAIIGSFSNSSGTCNSGCTTAPVCTVKPLLHVSSKLDEDLDDTVSAIEALCSLNNKNQGSQGLGLSHEPSTTSPNTVEERYDHTSNVLLSTKISNDNSSILEDAIRQSNIRQVLNHTF